MKRMWIRTGAVAGLIGALAYPFFLFVPLPLSAVVWVVALFGICISVAAAGLYFLLALHRRTVSLQIGTGATVVAGVMVLCMLICQLSVNAVAEPMLADPPAGTSVEMVRLVWHVVDQVQLGLDIVWDIYLCLATLLIAWNMRRHPRFGLFFFVSGVLIAAPLLVLNLSTFPTPPDQAGLVDLGPLAGLWYLAASIQVLRSLKWADGAIEAERG